MLLAGENEESRGCFEGRKKAPKLKIALSSGQNGHLSLIEPKSRSRIIFLSISLNATV